MKRNRLFIQAIPYVPGMARGVLHRGYDAAPGHISIYSPHDRKPPASTSSAIIVVEGAPFSHPMIRLRARCVPIVMVDKSAAAQLVEGTEVVVDGASGLVTDEPDNALTKAVPATPEPGRPVLLADGEEVHLLASVASVASARAALSCGGGAIGLLRSEFLQPADERLPDESYYRAEISEICAAAAPLSVTFRLLDVARDKTPQWLPATAADGDALGMHGVRLFREAPVRRVLHAQLAALDALNARFNLRVLVPSLANYDEMGYWVDYVRQRLAQPIAIGAMAETPAGVLDMHRWFDTADFVAVGCNDLMQCLFGADRDRPGLRAYLDPYAPALFRFLRYAAEMTAADLDRTRLCGLLPQLHGVLPILIGLGYRVFSVDPYLIPYLAQTVRQITLADTRAMSMQACEAADSGEIMQMFSEHLTTQQHI